MGPSGYCHRKLQTEFGCVCCRLSGIDASAIELPRVCLPAFRFKAFPLWLSQSLGCRFRFASSAPSKPHRLEFRFVRPRRRFSPSKLLLFASHKSLASGFVHTSKGFVRPFGFSFSLFTVPFSLLFRSSPRPISIIKLHTLPHFHR